MASDGQQQQTLDAIHEFRRTSYQNGYRPLEVYSPGALARDGKPIPSAGKRPVGRKWREQALLNPPAAVVRRVSPQATNTGIVTGELSGLDVDVLNQEITDAIVAMIEAMLGPTPLSRIGRAPKILLCYRAEQPFAKLSTPKYRLPDGTEAQLEILGDGQQFVAAGIHPDTGQPFEWPDRSPLDVPLAALPTISAMQARDIVGHATSILIEAGGIIEKPESKSSHGGRSAENGQFFRAVNDAALAEIVAWASSLGFHDRGGNSGWRITSKELGRPLQEDISIHPAGIWDFGEEKPLTAIDVVIKYGGAPDAPQAAFWLCDKLEIKPPSLGWRDKKAKPQPAPAPDDPVAPPAARRILTGADFVASFVAPDWLIDGIIQRGRLYACTSRTGHGKTAVWLYNGCMIHQGRSIGHLEVDQGNVLILAGENPEDLKARMIGMGRAFNLKPEQMPYVLPGSFPMTEEEAEKLRRDIDALGVPFALIIGDTAASFFPGDDENNNVQAGQYGRTLRSFTQCNGNPAVVALCHPIKNATRENLLPRGGGALLNELDGNQTLWSAAQGEMTTLHWLGKIRGPDFEPLHYALKEVETGYRDKRGHAVLTIVAEPINEIEAGFKAAEKIDDEDAVLKVLHRNPLWSLADIARYLTWLTKTGEPNKTRVYRALERLEEDRLVKNFRHRWSVTPAGKDALEQAEKEDEK